MYIHGEYINGKGSVIAVHILTKNDRSTEVVIGNDDSGIHFSDSPVEITGEVNDTFDPLLPYQAVLHLQTRKFLSHLFSSSYRDSVVNIFRDNECVFAGFIEPRAFSQGFNEVFDDIDITCVDMIGALKYAKYKQVGAAGVSYETVRSESNQRLFFDILKECVITQIDITGGHAQHIYYDGSKGLSDSDRYGLLSKLSINDLLFLADDETSVWGYDQILQEVLRYLGLHAVQVGFDIYLYSWETLKTGEAIRWKDLISGSIQTSAPSLTTISLDNVEGTSSTVSIGDTFNKIKVKCETKSMSEMIENPMDSETLRSPFSGVQPYLKEFISTDDSPNFLSAYSLIHDLLDGNEKSKTVTWYIQVKKSLHWKFGAKGIDLVAQKCDAGINQQDLPNYLSKNMGAAVIAFGSVKRKLAVNDIREQSKLDMEDCLVISVNGNGNDDFTATFPKEADLKNNIPCAIYTGGVGGGVLSPPDDSTTNYIVFSGSIALNPLYKESAPYRDLQGKAEDVLIKTIYSWFNFVDGRDEHGRFYTRQWFKAARPSDNAVWDENNTGGLMPYSPDCPQYYEFRYAGVGDNNHYDNVDKVGMIACMLIIGDKCAVERTGSGAVDDIVWKKYKTREECASDDEYYQQSFTLGFNPKIEDKIIGTEFDLQNNVSYKMNLDIEGTAIPIKRSDRLGGKVQFLILGPVNATWSEITKRHKTFFRSEKWKENTIPLLAHISDIVIKKFEVKVCSDNGKLTGHGDNDIVYMSDTDEAFVNPKDDITFKINSALSVSEREVLGVGSDLNLSTPLNVETGNGLLTIYDYNIREEAKPEQLYVNSAYKEWHKPRVILTQDFADVSGVVNQFGLYAHPALGLKMFVQSLSRDLGDGVATLTLKDSSML